jgi:hypothetical protein
MPFSTAFAHASSLLGFRYTYGRYPCLPRLIPACVAPRRISQGPQKHFRQCLGTRRTPSDGPLTQCPLLAASELQLVVADPAFVDGLRNRSAVTASRDAEGPVPKNRPSPANF